MLATPQPAPAVPANAIIDVLEAGPGGVGRFRVKVWATHPPFRGQQRVYECVAASEKEAAASSIGRFVGEMKRIWCP